MKINYNPKIIINYKTFFERKNNYKTNKVIRGRASVPKKMTLKTGYNKSGRTSVRRDNLLQEKRVDELKNNIKKLERKVQETQEMVEFYKNKKEGEDGNSKEDKYREEVEKLAAELKQEKLSRLEDIERLENKLSGKDRELNVMRQTFAQKEDEAQKGIGLFIFFGRKMFNYSFFVEVISF